MALLATLDALWTGQVGDWCIVEPGSDGCHYIGIVLPGATDVGPNLCLLPVVRDGEQACDQRPHWRWDGNREAPTLEPSILHHSEPPWHGFLRAGVLVTA